MGSVPIFMITVSIPVYSVEKKLQSSTQIVIIIVQLISGANEPLLTQTLVAAEVSSVVTVDAVSGGSGGARPARVVASWLKN